MFSEATQTPQKPHKLEAASGVYQVSSVGVFLIYVDQFYQTV